MFLHKGRNIDQYILDNKEYADLLVNAGIDSKKVILHSKDTLIFKEYKIDKQIDNMASKRVDIKNGGYLVIEPTEALTVIDVNTGKFNGENQEQTIYDTNVEAAKTIAKEIRRRNIGGIIVVDFIDMDNEEHKSRLVEVLNEELKKDIVKTTPAQLSVLGLVEFARERIRKSILNYMLTKEYSTIKIRDKIMDSALRNSGYPIIEVECNNYTIDSLNCSKCIDKVGILQNKQIYLLANNDMLNDEIAISFYPS